MPRDLTHDEHVCASHVLMYGDETMLYKVKGGWIIDTAGIMAPLGHVPKVFKTKREALGFARNLFSLRYKQWRGLED